VASFLILEEAGALLSSKSVASFLKKLAFSYQLSARQGPVPD